MAAASLARSGVPLGTGSVAGRPKVSGTGSHELGADTAVSITAVYHTVTGIHSRRNASRSAPAVEHKLTSSLWRGISFKHKIDSWRAVHGTDRWTERGATIHGGNGRVVCSTIQDLGMEWQTSMSYEQAITLQAQEEESLLFRYGPPPGDMAEVEAFSRIYRLAEQLHVAVMDSLRTLSREAGQQPRDDRALAASRSTSMIPLGAPLPEEEGDVPEAEERVVAGLAQLGSILQQSRLEVLCGNGALSAGPRPDPQSGQSDSPPPLARMRAKLKDACLQLQEALEALMPAEEKLTETVKQRLERLKNACLDAGFPRPGGFPSPADIPNFAAVRLRPFRAGRKFDPDEEIAFWRGGQVTEEGFQWLLEKGFRTIVDMRGTDVGNQWIKPAIDDPAHAHQLNHVSLPVDFGSTPTMEQVETLARLVADETNQPLYLHSQGGVGRSCAMVSRWREFVLRGGLEQKYKPATAAIGPLASWAASGRQPAVTAPAPASVGPSVPAGSSGSDDDDYDDRASLLAGLGGGRSGEGRSDGDEVSGSGGPLGLGVGNEGGEGSGSLGSGPSAEARRSAGRPGRLGGGGSAEDPAGGLSHEGAVGEGNNSSSARRSASERGGAGESGSSEGQSGNGLREREMSVNSALPTPSIRVVKNALEAQRPRVDPLSRKGMSAYLSRRKSAPSILERTRIRLVAKSGQSQAGQGTARPAKDVADGTIAGPAGYWGLAEPGIPRAGHAEEAPNWVARDSSSDEDDENVELTRVGGGRGEPESSDSAKGSSLESRGEGEAAQQEEEGGRREAGGGSVADVTGSAEPALPGSDKAGGLETEAAEAARPGALFRVETGAAASANGAAVNGPANGALSGSETPNENGNGTNNGTLLRIINGTRNGTMNGTLNGTLNGTVNRNGNGATRSLEVDEADEVAYLRGDMCASTTGVVRLQSRRKAEMYLVRTDGFSCTREKVKESTLAFTHPSTQQQMLMWKTRPKTCLLLKKLGDELMEEAQAVASWLHNHEGINVVVEPELHDRFARIPGFGFIQTYYNEDTSKLHERVDFVVCLGGDGVILHASNLFRSAVPPVVSFNLGSLGFLTAHPFEEFRQDLRAIIHGNNTMEGVYITLRMRLRCELFRNGKPIPGKVFEVLNEVVVDRGSNPYLCKIECYERNRLITKVQADGVLVATPTGSTAYSTAAGGSMVHPNVPCMLFTPICPHSLSFRPVILPDSALFELKVPNDARSNAWVSFDGKKRQQLGKGDSVRVRMSEHPLPTVNKSDQTDDWFRSLGRCLSWNERMEQKALSISP